MENLVGALDFLFGCHHPNLSRVFTHDGQTYRMCCDCGAQVQVFADDMAVKRRLLDHRLVR